MKPQYSLATLMLGLFLLAVFPADDGKGSGAEDSRIIKAIFDEVLVSAESYKLLDHLSNQIGPRLSGSEGAARAVQWTKEVMLGYGFDRVFLQDVMVPHWVRGAVETAHIVLPSGNRVDLKVTAIGGSVATPEGGVTAEVVEVQGLEELTALGKQRVAGKIVFYNRAFDQRSVHTGRGYGGANDQRVDGPSRAAEFGAAAVVIRSVTTAFDDAPHTGMLSYKPDIDRIPAAAFGVQSADKLTEALRARGPLKLHLELSGCWLPDAKSHNVIGELRGSEHPDEIIVVGGHLDSWDLAQGAHDDGAGCVHAIGALRALQRIGYKPRRTLRAVMFMNEENGLRGGRRYAALALENQEKHLAAIESDAGGFSPRGFGVTASEAAIDKIRSWLPHFDPNTISYIEAGGGGADINPLNKSQGIPVIGLITDSQRYFDVHHSEHDHFGAVDRRELELGTGSLAALIYLLDKYGL